MVVFNSTVQGAVPDRVRGQVFTLLDASWSAMRLLTLALGGAAVNAIDIKLGGALGMALLGRHDFRTPAPEPAAS